ncbi:MAG: hypothetical protein IKI22_04035 [Neisseriaceae bacterium]|nr:hypothetical protein [Neisseriaceae bacterium]
MTSNRKNRVLQESLLYLQYLSKLLQNLTMNKKNSTCRRVGRKSHQNC